ncbi:sugar nucleotide-binding protein [Pseudomonas sp. NFXW11]|uniref:NAD-dependent epimerase/dehydratase family protein n=1 Tax=Pseudomonas sp. NFXW11 TaxID=2819531 RepID=UPI003CEAB9AF
MTLRIFVVGASGYIGKALHQAASAEFEVYGTSSSKSGEMLELSLGAPDDFDYEVIGSNDIVFLTAAISAPDICAREYEYARSVNVVGTSEFIRRVIARGARLVFFSSDTVYGEQDFVFDEKTETRPAGEYAEMKCEVENLFLADPLFKSVRLSYVFSREDKFTKYLTNCAKKGEEAELFHPFYRAVVHRDDVVEGALALARRWSELSYPIINFAGPEIISRVEFAERLKSSSLPELEYKVVEPDSVFFKNRPRMISMSSGIFCQLLGRPARSLSEAAEVEFS